MVQYHCTAGGESCFFVLMSPNEFVETLTFQKNDSDNELRQDVNLNIFICYQDRKAKYLIS